MSRSVDLFIDADAPIDEVAANLGELLGSPLAEGPGPRTWLLQEGTVEAVLTCHPFLDDGELLLSRYRYALSARVPNTVRVQDAPETALLRHVAERVLRGSHLPALLVFDLQYRDRPGGDSVSSDCPAPAGEDQ
jgi:hypothetical protein